MQDASSRSLFCASLQPKVTSPPTPHSPAKQPALEPGHMLFLFFFLSSISSSRGLFQARSALWSAYLPNRFLASATSPASRTHRPAKYSVLSPPSYPIHPTFVGQNRPSRLTPSTESTPNFASFALPRHLKHSHQSPTPSPPSSVINIAHRLLLITGSINDEGLKSVISRLTH